MNEDVTLLKAVYNSSKKASATLGALLPHVENKSLRTTMLSQIYEYDAINRRAGEEIISLGMKPKEQKKLKNKFSLIGKSVSAGIDPSLSHIAEIITDEANSYKKETTRTMNRCQNSRPQVYNLARMLINADKESGEKLKKYL